MIVDSDLSLRNAIDVCLKQEAVALDTEFVWERTFFPKLGLIQIGLANQQAYLVDTLKIKDFSPLGELLQNSKVTKILHDAMQDLIILYRVTQVYPKTIFDSKLAAGFVGLTSSLSLRELIKRTLRIDIPKDQTRSNWIKRPLTDKQLSYAQDDVIHLNDVREFILKKAQDLDRSQWIDEEMKIFEVPNNFQDPTPQELLFKIKGRGRIKSHDMSSLMALAELRDQIAKELDRPRGHVIKDESVVEICLRKPDSKNKLKLIPGISEQIINKYSDDILRCLTKQSDDNLFPTMRSDAESDSQSACIDFLMACIKGKSLKFDIDPTLLATRANISDIVRFKDRKQSRLFQGWRNEFIGLEIRKILKGDMTVRIDPKIKLPTLMTT